jgi:hypothetical protein
MSRDNLLDDIDTHKTSLCELCDKNFLFKNKGNININKMYYFSLKNNIKLQTQIDELGI